MITVIWIEGQKWDLYSDTNIKHTIQANNIAELKDRQASFTNSIPSPKTANNIRIAQGLGISSDTSRIPYQKPSCQVKLDGYDLIVKGWLNITETDDEYKIYIYSGIISFFKAIENITIGDLDLSEIDHTKNLTTVISSFSNPNYKYLITDFNGLTHYGTNDEIINIDYLIPFVSVKYLWDKIHSTYLFNYSGDTFSSEEFNNLWLSYPKYIAVDESEDMIEGSGSRYVDLFNSGGNELNYYRGMFMSEFNNYRSFTAPETAQYRITFEINNTFDNLLLATIKYFISVNQENLPWIDRTNSILVKEISASTSTQVVTYIISLNQGDTISFYDYMKMNGYLRWNSEWNIKIEKIIPGTTSFTDELKDFSITDFVKEIINQFGLTMLTDEFSNNIRYLSISERINNAKIKDWSEKYIQRKSENYVYESYAQKNLFTYKYDDSEASYNDGSININNLNITDKKTAFSSRLYSPEKTLVEFYIGSSGSEFLRVFKFYNKEVQEKDSETTINYKGLENRFHFARMKTITTTVQIGSKTLLDQQTVTSIPIAEFTKLDWSSLLSNNYQPLGRILNDSRIHQIELNLNLMDLLTLDLSDLFFFYQESQYYILNKLNTDTDKATGDFVRVKKVIENADIENPDGEVIIEIAWMDGTKGLLSGTASNIQMQIINLETPPSVSFDSFDWEVYNSSIWSTLGAGITPYTASLSIGIQRFRIKAISGSNTYYSNELQYTKIVYNCHKYYAWDYGNSGDDLTAIYIDCDGVEQYMSVSAPGGTSGFHLELTFCAVEGSVSISRGILEDQGEC